MGKDYNIIIIFFDKNGIYCRQLKCPKSEAYDNIEEWSRTAEGMCQVIDMRVSLEILKREMKYKRNG